MSVASDPASRAAVVTPSDSTVVAANALYIGVTGDVALVVRNGDSAITFKAVPVGVLKVNAYKVMATGTTATNIVALY